MCGHIKSRESGNYNMSDVAIIDYNMGNINSIKNMLHYLGYEGILTNDPEQIRKAEKIILPGVGHYKKAMDHIVQLGLDGVLKEVALKQGKPILGICLGMQLLLSRSEEGNSDGLGLIQGEVKKFELDSKLYKVPHMGWDYIDIQTQSPLFQDIQGNPRYYFVHSYYVQCADLGDVLASTEYGIRFHSVVGHGNIVGTQFHPEKSHKFGMKILQNFMERM